MSSQVSSGRLAPYMEAPTELMITGLSFIAKTADRTAMFRAGKEPEKLTATASPARTPASSSIPTTTAANCALVDVLLDASDPVVVVRSL